MWYEDRVNPSAAALLKPSARCLLLNHVFPWADLYLHLKVMLIVQICKQSRSDFIKGTSLLWELSSRKQAEVWKVFLSSRSWPSECRCSETSAWCWGPPPNDGFLNWVWCETMHLAGGLLFHTIFSVYREHAGSDLGHCSSVNLPHTKWKEIPSKTDRDYIPSLDLQWLVFPSWPRTIGYLLPTRLSWN